MDERLKRLILGDRQTVAGTVYGTIIVMSVIAAGGKAYEHHLWRLVVLAGGSSVVLWFVRPLAAVGLGAGGVLAERPSVQLALWLGVVVLAAQGIRYARLEHLHPAATFVTISLNLAIGLALVGLEVLFAH